MEEQKKRDEFNIDLPSSIIESFARFLVPEIRKYYQSEEGQKEFQKWQEEQEEKRIHKKRTVKAQTLTVHFLLTSQSYPYCKATFEVVGVRVMSTWWR